jgi:bacillopeptidase F
MISLLFIFGAGFAAQAQVIDPELAALLDTLDPDDEVDVLVTLTDQVDLKEVKDKNKDKPKDELRTALITELKDKKDKTQKVIKDLLKGKATKITSLWIFNGLAVTATKEVIIELADQPGIESIRLDDILVKSDSVSAGEGAPTGAPEWNLNTIRAPELWASGHTGAGVVVAIMDTGVDAQHPDLASRWRGGSNSWYDPNGEHATPYDADGHGTQVMGVLVGGDAGGTTIGVSPGATWIAVKMYNDAGSASYSDIHQGFQWVLDPDGNASTNDAADVVNNSWSLGNVGGCDTEFESDILTLKEAQIAVVFSGGNYGPSSSSVSPANNPGGFAVGSVDDQDNIASSSSRGPSACNGPFYPEVVAPGVNVRTSDLTFGGVFPDSYANATGTSIAAPHVAGAMALLLSTHSDATVGELEQALEDAALDLGAAGPDNDSGYGLIDVVAAESWLADPPGPVCSDSDGDLFFAEDACGTELDCNDFDAGINPDACDIKGDGIDQDCDGTDRTKGKPCPGSGDDGGGDPVGVEGKGQTCTDGIDNDGDGSIDCGDSDCSKNKACK